MRRQWEPSKRVAFPYSFPEIDVCWRFDDFLDSFMLASLLIVLVSILAKCLPQRLKSTETVKTMGFGVPLTSIGSYFHCLTASRAAWSSSGMDLITLALMILPLASRDTLSTTVPS